MITTTGKAGCAFVAYDSSEKNELYQKCVAQPKWTSNSESEVFTLSLGVGYAMSKKRNAILICDSVSALQSLNSERPQYINHVSNIQRDLIKCHRNGLSVQFIWVPSHVGIKGNERADELAKAGARKYCGKQEVISLKQFRSLLKNEKKEELELTLNGLRPESCSIKHYDQFRNIKHSYGKGGCLQAHVIE